MSFAFHFPGQGSQSKGMLADCAQHFRLVLDTFTEASDTLHYDLWDLVQNNPDGQLDQTAYTQPALLAASVALWRCWDALGGPTPSVLAGHSLGEYSAYVVADALTFTDAIRLVSLRGQFMQAAVGADEGAMAAVIGLDDETIESVCRDAAQGLIVSPANFNSVGQVVVSGDVDAVMRAIDLAKAQGAKIAKRIPVSVPSHCALMAPAMAQLAEVLREIPINTPSIPVLSNVDAASHCSPDDIREQLAQQLIKPVQWVKTVLEMREQGVTRSVECGPGKVLAGLNKRIDRAWVTESIQTADALQAVCQSLQECYS